MSRFNDQRRRFLKGLGLAVALPTLERFALSPAQAAQLPATTADGDPLRLAFLYIPNGVNVDRWFPEGEGKDYKLGQSFDSVKHLRDDFQFVRGMELKGGWAGPDGPGDHARANASFLTGMRPKKTAGADIEVGISVDQVAANHIGGETRFSSLELSCDGVRKSGSCDSGYSCAYQFNLAWRTPHAPLAPEQNPRLVFERLFGGGEDSDRDQNRKQRMYDRRSVLDFVMEEANQLHKELGNNDRQKMDEYLTGIREIERRIERAEQFGDLPSVELETPSGIPARYEDHIRLMLDIQALAFQTDSTRVATFLLAHDGSNRSFKEVGVSEGHHHLSHHQKKEDWLEKIAKIDEFYISQFGYFLEKMKELKDPSGKSLLDNSMIVFGGGLSDGNRHNHDNLPIVLAGRGGGSLNPGKVLNAGEKVPMTNLYVSLMENMGIPEDEFADSTGKLSNL